MLTGSLVAKGISLLEAPSSRLLCVQPHKLLSELRCVTHLLMAAGLAVQEQAPCHGALQKVLAVSASTLHKKLAIIQHTPHSASCISTQ